MEEEMSEQELFENAYYYFIKAVEVLSKDPVSQCQAMGNYNVAWEIRDDVAAGAYMLNIAGANLTQQQSQAISQLVAQVSAVPDSVVQLAQGSTGNLVAMQASCWEPLRTSALSLLAELAPVTAKVWGSLAVGQG